MNTHFDLPMAADRLIPQRPPLCAIYRLAEYHGGQGVVEAAMPHEGIFLRDDGTIEPMVIVEIVAQSFAAVKGYENLLEGDSVCKGYLVEIKRFEFYGAIYGGDHLSIVTNRVGEADEFTLAEGKVIRDREVIASGNLMVWVPREA
jgi:3-hydroxyacyl-[acyl-carrier-protein] dehydratase